MPTAKKSPATKLDKIRPLLPAPPRPSFPPTAPPPLPHPAVFRNPDLEQPPFLETPEGKGFLARVVKKLNDERRAIISLGPVAEHPEVQDNVSATTQSPVVRLVPATDMPTPVSIAPNDNVACPGRGLDKVSNLSQPSSQSPRAEGQRTTCERTPTVTLESNDVSIPTIAHDQRAISVEEAAVSNVTTRETTMPLPEALTQSNESQPAFKEMPREIIDLEALNQSETTAASRTDYPPASSVAYNRPTPAATSSEPDKELFKLLAPVVQDLRVMVKYLSEAVPNEIILKFHRDYQARAKRLIALVIDSRGKLRSYRFVSARTPRIVNMTEQMRGCAWDISHEIAKICRADRVGADAAAQRDAALSRLQSLDRKYSWNIEMCAMLLENQPA